MKQRNLWPGNMQGPLSSPPLYPGTYLSDPFDIDNETKAKEVHLSAYPKSSLSNESQKTSKLSGRQNEESQKCDNATGSYNLVYMDDLLSRQFQNKEFNSLEQRVYVLNKKKS